MLPEKIVCVLCSSSLFMEESGLTTCAFKERVNLEPMSFSLSRCMVPCINSKIILDIHKPKPVPPNYLLTCHNKVIRLDAFISLAKWLEQVLLVVQTNSNACINDLDY